MAVVLRVKRKLEEEPANGLVVFRKKAKNDDTEQKPKLFRLVGTVKNKKDDMGFLHTAIRDGKLEALQCRGNDPKTRKPQILPKLREESRQKSRESRLKIINAHRPLEPDSVPNEECAEVVTSLYKLYDVVEMDSKEDQHHNKEKSKKAQSITLNGVELTRRQTDSHQDIEDYDLYDESCVYDIYYAQDFDDRLSEKDFSIERCALHDELVNMDYRDDGEECYPDDDDDSNEEDNWRNDYPDEDSDFEKEYDFFRDYEDDEEKEMVERLQGRGFELDDADSDDSEDPDDVKSFQLLHHRKQDVQLHGYKYAKYKNRILKELNDNSEDDSDDT